MEGSCNAGFSDDETWRRRGAFGPLQGYMSWNDGQRVAGRSMCDDAWDREWWARLGGSQTFT